SPQVRALIAAEVRRAADLLDEGAPIVGTLRGFARAAVAGYVAGGRAALAAIRASGCDVLTATPRPRKRRVAAELLRAHVRGGGAAPPARAPPGRRGEELPGPEPRTFPSGRRLPPRARRPPRGPVPPSPRRIDDIGDGTLPAPEKLAALEQARGGLAALMAGRPDDSDEVFVALADAGTRFDIPLAAFGELIDGCADDGRGVSYATFDDLLHYCRCSAGSMGRLSLGVFGTGDPGTAVPLADSLGVALQLTNILRDIREDYVNGRVYLPAEDLARFGCTLDADPATHPSQGKLTAVVEFEADRARSWYAKGLALMPLLDRRSAARARAWHGRGLAPAPPPGRRSAAPAGARAGPPFRPPGPSAARPAGGPPRRVSPSAREKARLAGRARGDGGGRERPGDRGRV